MRLVLLLVLVLAVTACGAASSAPRQCRDARTEANAACVAPSTKCSQRQRVQERGQPFARVHCGVLP